VLEALTKWLDELTGGRKFTVVTDHKALTYFKEKNHTTPRHIRWQNFFHGFNCDIVYVQGHTNKVADALSRYYESSSDENLHYDDYVSADIRIDKEGDDLPLARAEEARELLYLHGLRMTYTRIAASRAIEDAQEERDLQANELDPPEDRQGRRELSLEGILPPLAELRPHVEDKNFIASVKDGYSKHVAWRGILAKASDFPKFSIVDGLIFRLNDSGEPLLVLPESIHQGERITGIAIEHAHRILGHLGAKKTLEYVRKHYWWSSMSKDIEKFCTSCGTCQTTKKSKLRYPGLLHQLPIPEKPWESIAMDFVGPFPTSLNYNYLWVVLCRLTCQVHLVPVTTQVKTIDLAHLFLQHVVRLHGMPTSIVSDRDTKFTSQFWTELHRLMGVKLKLTTAFHPQGDGQAERAIQTVVQILRSFVRPDQRDWAVHIPMVEFALNSSANKSTGFAPFELVYGYLPQMTVSLPSSELPGVKTFAQRALDNIQAAHDAIIKSRVEQAVQANRHRRPDSPKLKKGDYAYLSTKDLNLPKGRAHKLLPTYIGPYEILEVFEDSSNYVLRLPPVLTQRNIFAKFHVSRLAPHEPNDSILFPGRAVEVFYDFGEDPEREYQVKEIVDHRWDDDNSLWFRVRWGLGDLTWEPLANVNDLIALDDYLIVQGVENVEELNRQRRVQTPDNRSSGLSRPRLERRLPVRYQRISMPYHGQLWR
jgi:hypothetical protein